MKVSEFDKAWKNIVAPADPEMVDQVSDDAPVVVSVPGLGPIKVNGIKIENHSDSFAGAQTVWIEGEEM